MNTERPSVSKETILTAARKIANRVNGDGCAEDIANCYHDYIDGYELAKKLENEHCWDIDMCMIDDLDCMHSEVDSAHGKILKQWVIDDNITPPFKNETKIKQGVIKGVYEYGSAIFKVKEYGCNVETRHLLIKFEDAVEVK